MILKIKTRKIEFVFDDPNITYSSYIDSKSDDEGNVRLLNFLCISIQKVADETKKLESK